MKVIIPNITIRSIASWLPKNKISLQSFIPKYSEKEVRDVIRTTGVEQVYRADNGVKASELSYNAAEYLICRDNINRDEIDGLIFVSATRDWILPDTSIYLQDKLKLSKETICQDINYGCTGYIYGLLQASLWIQSGLCQKVLVLTGEILSEYLNPEAVGSIDSSDIATATLVTQGTENIAFHIYADGSKSDRIVLPHNGYLYQDGMGVFSFSIVNAPKSIKNVLELQNWNDSDIDVYALHQSNQLVIKNIRMTLRSLPEKFPTNMKNYGNSSSSTIPHLLCDLYGDNINNHPSKSILCAFGVGLTCGSIAVDFTQTKFYEPLNK